MKRILAIILCLCMLPMLPRLQAFAAGTQMEQKAEVIAALGIADGDENGELNLDENITRAEMAVLLYKLKFGNEEPTVKNQIFADVSRYFWAAGYIEQLYGAGIIQGDESGNFRPKDMVTLTEASVMLLNIAGYAEYMDMKGGYPEGCMQAAGETGLDDGVRGGEAHALTRGEVFTLIYNLLYIDVCKLNLANGRAEFTFGGNFMNEVMEVYSGKGILDGAAGTTLSGGQLPAGYVSIEEQRFDSPDSDWAAVLGFYGEYYYRDNNGDKTLLYFSEKNNTVLNLDHRMIMGYDNNQYTYEGERTTKRARLYNGKDIIYNGKVITNDCKMMPEYGFVKLIDNNRDGVYEVVIIDEYQNIFAGYVSAQDEQIYYNVVESGTDSKKALDLTKYAEYSIYDSKGNKKDLGDIMGNQVLMLQENTENQLKITICGETVQGTVSSFGQDENDETVFVIDGIQYKMPDSAYVNGWDRSVGSNVELYLDSFGTVAAVIGRSDSATWKYGFVIKAYRDEDTETFLLKLLSQDGNVLRLVCDEKAYLDGIKMQFSGEELAQINVQQVIRYLTNQAGDIRKIDLPTPQTYYDQTYRVMQADDKLLKRCDGPLQWKSVVKAFRSYTTMTLEGQAFVDDDTIIFRVPENTAEAEDLDYQRIQINQIADHSQLRVVAYNDESQSLSTKVIVIYTGVNAVGNHARAMLVDTVNAALDSEDNQTYQITGLYLGNNVSYTLKNAEDIDYQGHRITTGDVIRVAVQGDVITDCDVLYNQYGTGLLNMSASVGTGTGYDSETRYAIGYVNDMDQEKIIFKFDDANRKPEVYHADYFSIYVYDPDNNRKSMVYAGSLGDIVDRQYDPQNYDTVIVGTQNSVAREMIVIKR